MSPLPVTPAQLRGLAQQALRHDPGALAIGVRAGGMWTGSPEIEAQGRAFRVLQSNSVLEIREHLATLGPGPGSGLILLTGQSEHELGGDVLARLARGRLLTVDPWSIVAELFQARRIDPRLARQRWLAEALLEAAPREGYPAVPTGLLDRETTWKAFLGSYLGLMTPRPTLRELLEWTRNQDAVSRFVSAPKELQNGVIEWLAESVGPLTPSIFRCVENGNAVDAVPLGLVCSVLFGAERETEPELREASVRLERYLGDKPLDSSLAAVWAEGAEIVLTEVHRLAGHAQADQIVTRADAILQEIRAGRFAHLSRFSARGFEDRLSRFGEQLVALLGNREGANLEEVESLAEVVRSHTEADLHPDRGRRVSMAVRLLRWLTRIRNQYTLPPSLEDAALEYAGDGGFADWARAALAGGDGQRVVAHAYGQLLNEATALRENQNRHFAGLLTRWIESGGDTQRLLPVEKALELVVAPLAEKRRVLLLVIDGMSFPVFRQLLLGGLERRWVPIGLPSLGTTPPLVATVPSITELSRTSLLCGELRQGTAQDEGTGFARHKRMLAASSAGHPPVLFHKARLFTPGGADLSGDFREAITNSRQRVVGAVINAVDDFLLKGDQILVQWTVEGILGLPAVMDLARQTDRVVVLASDHGHVLDRSTEQVRQDNHDRFRTAEGPALASEFLASGPRVIAPGGQVFAAWSEGVRYGPKKNGYHGGLSPQEMLAPLAVLRPIESPLEAWPDLPYDVPDWWDRPLRVASPFPAVPGARPTAPFPPAVETPAWLDRLLASALFSQQMERVQRQVHSMDEPRRFVSTLLGRGGTIHEKALARALGKTVFSISGFVAVMQRLFNVEGYAVVEHDRASATIRLNTDLLKRQFGID